MSSIEKELDEPNTEDYQENTWDEDNSWRWHITVRAYEAARMAKPDLGVEANNEADFACLTEEVAKQCALFKVDQNEERYTKEILRFGNA